MTVKGCMALIMEFNRMIDKLYVFLLKMLNRRKYEVVQLRWKKARLEQQLRTLKGE